MIPNKVGVICVVGPWSSGKSYLTSKISGESSLAFNNYVTMDRSPPGVWIRAMARPISGIDCTIILMETDGIDPFTSGQRDNALFAFSVLMSSYLIYNSIGIPVRTTIDHMQ